MKKYIPFISFWLLNSILLHLATTFYPLNFVLGNFWLSKLQATLWAGFWVTALVWSARTVSERLNIKLEGRLRMFLFYWLANAAAIWLVARFAPLTGFGISRFTWAIGLGLVMNVAQWGLWQGLKGANLVNRT